MQNYKYKLTNTEEPTDKELEKLMLAVSKKVIQRSKIANENFKNIMNADFIAVQKKYNTLIKND